MFGDSSEEVFCAVAFLRARVKTSLETQIAFAFGKARVEPMKARSIPKLELQAALLATRLKEDVLKALTIPVSNTFMWTDSTTVLQWLNSGSKQPTIVANLIGEILESTTVDQWFHFLSGDNPADTGTRGISAESLKTSSWVNGPSLLKSSEWPFKPSIEVLKKIGLAGPACDPNEGLEQASNFSNVAQKQKQPILFAWEEFSSFRKLQRMVAFLLRLSPKHRHYRTKVKEKTDPVELETAKQRLLLISQKESFEAEYLLLSCDKTFKKSSRSRIAQYALFMGPAFLIRSTGRIRRLVETEYDTKHPIILDGRHTLVKLFVSDIHYCYQHQFLDYLRAVIHLAFAILYHRSLLKSIEVHCLICRKRKAKTVTHMMAELPVERLGYRQPPFTNCGVDYFGPFYVSIRRSSEKRWRFLFTCMTTRAVHIEIVSSMETSSCEMGIERFIARRGTPSVIWPDNGTNFVGAEKEILNCIQSWNGQAPPELGKKGIKWQFNPPAAPHHGGSCERLVRCCKRVFYAIIGSRKLTPEVLETTFCLVEQSLNARPITSVSASPDGFEVLTPNYFLLGQNGTSVPSLSFQEHFDHRKQYIRAQSYANAIWSRWLRDYVPALNKRSKWHSDSDVILKTGDLVWIVDEGSPRGHYPMARIKTLNYGKDNIARSAVEPPV